MLLLRILKAETFYECLLLNGENNSLSYFTERRRDQLTLKQQYDELICSLKSFGVSNCSVKALRFSVMIHTFESFRKTWLNITNLNLFVETAVNEAMKLKIPIRLQDAFYFIMPGMRVSVKTPLESKIKECRFYMSSSRVMFSSPQFNLTAEKLGYVNGRIVFDSFTISSAYDLNNKTKVFTQTYEFSNEPSLVKEW